ncbi:hypothetical protein J0A67_06880 [Algoriphagus aestuariicola]|uniref:Uncharacterized protein n=1 Tax=Algoriphagus aestuariicola TaxID=1852016 RepID=A0ABS3BMN7_9BACT|nr:hypothetical protein [Algoriphagus aestuariicola]MBN7800577.1 hypothetical protein [Algoriphagus aestuariicola]
MGFFRKSYEILNKLTPLKSQYVIFIIITTSIIIGFFSYFDQNLSGTIGTFVALFSGILFSFSFLMFDASKKKKNEILEIFDELGITIKSFKRDQYLPENEKYNQSDILTRLRYIEFADTLFTLIILLVIISIIIFTTGISLGISLNIVFLERFQTYLYKFGITFYTFLVSIYLWVIIVLSIRVYRFYMYELKL